MAVNLPRYHDQLYGGVEGLRHHLCVSHNEHRDEGTSQQDLEDLHEDEHDYSPGHRGEWGCYEHSPEDTPTEWEELHKDIGDIHRGIGVDLPDHLHRLVHDPARPARERAQALLEHVQNHREGIGVHWTTEPRVAEDFGETSAKAYATERKPGTSVVLHAGPPEREHIDDSIYADPTVYRHGDHGEREVPLRSGEDAGLTGISWAPMHDDWDTPGHGEYTRHDFGNTEPHTAAAQPAEPEREWFYGEQPAHTAELPDEMHRGIPFRFPPEVHAAIHDDARPAAERAKLIMDHLDKWSQDGARYGGGGIGRHWSVKPSTARGFATRYDTQNHGLMDFVHDPESTQVIFHARTAEPGQMIRGKRYMNEHDIFGINHGEGEVPLKKRSRVALNGISWAQNGKDTPLTRFDFPQPLQRNASLHAPDPADELLGHFEAAAEPEMMDEENGPFYHGTRYDLKPGDLLTGEEAASHRNYPHIDRLERWKSKTGKPLYMSANPGQARWFADSAPEPPGTDRYGESGRARVYEVEPTGFHMHDPENLGAGSERGQMRQGGSRITDHPLRVVRLHEEWSGDHGPYREGRHYLGSPHGWGPDWDFSGEEYDRFGAHRRNSHEAAARPGRGQKACPCCKGNGSHGDGSECDPCDGSGLLHSNEPDVWCPGQPQPKRRHWREGAANSEYSAGRMLVSDIRRPGEGRLSERPYTQRELADDIRRNGVQQPLAIEDFPVHGGPTTFNGLHRLDAAQAAGVRDVPVVVKHLPGKPPAMTERRPSTEDEFNAAYDLERSGRWAGDHQMEAAAVPDRDEEQAAELLGHFEAADSSVYHGVHVPPGGPDDDPEWAAPMHDVHNAMPSAYDNPRAYPGWDAESERQLKAAEGRPDHPVTVYRALPAGRREINPGDWVTTSGAYARQHGESNLRHTPWHVVKADVPARHLFNEGYMSEWGYQGPAVTDAAVHYVGDDHDRRQASASLPDPDPAAEPGAELLGNFEAAAEPERRYYHASDNLYEDGEHLSGGHRLDDLYIADRPEIARSYYTSGHVYEVQPHAEPQPTMKHEYSVPSATVLRRLPDDEVDSAVRSAYNAPDEKAKRDRRNQAQREHVWRVKNDRWYHGYEGPDRPTEDEYFAHHFPDGIENATPEQQQRERKGDPLPPGALGHYEAAAEEHVTLYHGTSRENAEAIAREGYRPSENHIYPAKWFVTTDNRQTADAYASRGDGERATVEMHIPRSRMNEHLWPGEEHIGGQAYAVKKHVPPEWVAAVHPVTGWVDYPGDDDQLRTRREAASEMLDLYHHTTEENAEAILASRSMHDQSHRPDGPLYFSNIPHGFYGGDYGPAAVHVRVPGHLATPDDSFRNGEKFYTVKASDVRPEHIIGMAPDPSVGQRKAAKQREGDERAFGDYTMRYRTDDMGERRPRHIIETVHPDGSVVGRLNWYGTTGTIHKIEVADDTDTGAHGFGNGENHQRQGIATAMWNWGQEMSPKPKHSEDQSPQGEAWAASVGGPGLHRRKRRQADQDRTAALDVVAHFEAEAAVPEYGHKPEWDSERYEREGSDYAERQFAADRNWRTHIRRGLSLGHLTGDQAKDLGYHPQGHEVVNAGWEGLKSGWRPLPDKLYHVTTNLQGVREAGGLRSRQELGQESGGAGLGGGDDESISATTDPDMAHHILRALHEYHGFLNHGDPRELWEQAKRGDTADRPYHADVARMYHSDWKDGDPLPLSLDSFFRGKEIHNGLFSTQEDMDTRHGPGWTPHPRSDSFEAPKGTVHMQWERDSTPEERLREKSSFYKYFAGARHYAGGHVDPLFMGNDPGRLARMDPRNFAVLHLRPKPGAQGYPLSGMSEWRTHSGDALQTERAERLENGHMREASLQKETAMDEHPVTLYRGLHFGRGDAEAADDLHANPHKYLETDHGLGIHWTEDPGSAYNFSQDRDPSGWAHETVGDYDEDEGDEHSHSLGMVLRAQVHPRHIVQPGTEEHEGYQMADAVLDPDHPEQETTVREGAPVRVTHLITTSVGPDGNWREHEHPYGREHLAALAPGAEVVAHFADDEGPDEDDYADEDVYRGDDEDDEDESMGAEHEEHPEPPRKIEPYMEPPREGELIQHIHDHHGLDARSADLYMNQRDRERWHDAEHRGRTNNTHQHEQRLGTPGEQHWPDVFGLSEETDFIGGQPAGRHFREMLGDPERSRPFQPLPQTESVLRQEAAAVNDGDDLIAHFGALEVTAADDPESHLRMAHGYTDEDFAGLLDGAANDIAVRNRLDLSHRGDHASEGSDHAVHPHPPLTRDRRPDGGPPTVHHDALQVRMMEHRIRQGLPPRRTDEEIQSIHADNEARREQERADRAGRDEETRQARGRWLHDNGFASEDEHEQFMGQMHREHDDIAGHWRRSHREEYDEGGEWTGDDAITHEHLISDHLIPNPDARAASVEHGLGGLHWQHHIRNRETAHPEGLSDQWRPIPHSRTPDEQALMNQLGGGGQRADEEDDSGEDQFRMRPRPDLPYMPHPEGDEGTREHLDAEHGVTRARFQTAGEDVIRAIHDSAHGLNHDTQSHQHEHPGGYHDPVFGARQAAELVAHFDAQAGGAGIFMHGMDLTPEDARAHLLHSHGLDLSGVEAAPSDLHNLHESRHPYDGPAADEHPAGGPPMYGDPDGARLRSPEDDSWAAGDDASSNPGVTAARPARAAKPAARLGAADQPERAPSWTEYRGRGVVERSMEDHLRRQRTGRGWETEMIPNPHFVASPASQEGGVTHLMRGYMNGRPAGVIGVGASNNLRAWKIHNVHVRSEFRDAGIAPAMMDSLYDHVREQGGRWIDHGPMTHADHEQLGDYEEPHPEMNPHKVPPSEVRSGDGWNTYFPANRVHRDMLSNARNFPGTHHEPDWTSNTQTVMPVNKRWEKARGLPVTPQRGEWAEEPVNGYHDVGRLPTGPLSGRERAAPGEHDAEREPANHPGLQEPWGNDEMGWWHTGGDDFMGPLPRMHTMPHPAISDAILSARGTGRHMFVHPRGSGDDIAYHVDDRPHRHLAHFEVTPAGIWRLRMNGQYHGMDDRPSAEDLERIRGRAAEQGGIPRRWAALGPAPDQPATRPSPAHLIATPYQDRVAPPAGTGPLAPLSGLSASLASWQWGSVTEARELAGDFPGLLRAIRDGLLTVARRLDDCPLDESVPDTFREMAAHCLNASEDIREMLERAWAQDLGHSTEGTWNEEDPGPKA